MMLIVVCLPVCMYVIMYLGVLGEYSVLLLEGRGLLGGGIALKDLLEQSDYFHFISVQTSSFVCSLKRAENVMK